MEVSFLSRTLSRRFVFCNSRERIDYNSFCLVQGGVAVLLNCLVKNTNRSKRTNVLRALTLCLDNSSSIAYLKEHLHLVTKEIYECLLGLALSDIVLTVARSFQVLSFLTKPSVIKMDEVLWLIVFPSFHMFLIFDV